MEDARWGLLVAFSIVWLIATELSYRLGIKRGRVEGRLEIRKEFHHELEGLKAQLKERGVETKPTN